MQLLRKPGQMNIETLPDYERSNVAHHKKGAFRLPSIHFFR